MTESKITSRHKLAKIRKDIEEKRRQLEQLEKDEERRIEIAHKDLGAYVVSLLGVKPEDYVDDLNGLKESLKAIYKKEKGEDESSTDTVINSSHEYGATHNTDGNFMSEIGH